MVEGLPSPKATPQALAIYLGAVLLWSVLAALGHTQSATEPPGNVEVSAAASGDVSQDATSQADAPRGVSMAVSPGGLQRHVAGRWSTLMVSGANRTTEDAEDTIVVSVGDEIGLQYARRMWIPAGARRQSWLPIEIPADIPADQLQVDAKSMRLTQAADGEQFQSNFVGEPISRRSLLIDHDQSTAAIILDREMPDQPAHSVTEFQRSLVYAARQRLRLSQQDLLLPEFASDWMPPTPKSLDAIDQLVIGSDRLFSDSGFVAQLARWVRGGGRLWIMLDRIDPDAVHQLLGDDHCFTTVDSVELNRFRVETVDLMDSKSLQKAEPWESERPAQMLRILAHTDDVSARVDGWPAAFWIPFGDGEVLMTTLDASGWFVDGDPEGGITTAMHTVALRFFDRRVEPQSHLAAVTPMVDKQIGYTIPARSMIATILGLHSVALLFVGVWLLRTRRLQLLAAVVPTIALVATVSLLVIGYRKSRSIPPTIASGQIAIVSTDGSSRRTETVSAIYRGDRQPLSIVSPPKSTTELLTDSSDSQTKRILWDDAWQETWQFVTQRPGVVQHARTISVSHHAQPWIADGTFDENGFTATIHGVGNFADPVVVAPSTPTLSLTGSTDSSNQVRGSIDDVLPPGRFIKDSLMSQSQQQRQQFLQQTQTTDTSQMLTQDASRRRQAVLAWTDMTDSPVSFSGDYALKGWSLVSIPIHLRRPAPDRTFQIPATFVRLDTLAGTEGASLVFDPRTGKWLAELTGAKRVALRCVLPDEILPCRITKVSVAIKISAPSRTLSVEHASGEETVVIYEKANPTGLQVFEFDDTSVLDQAAAGELNLSVSVSATDSEIAAGQIAAGQITRTPATTDELSSRSPINPAASASQSTWSIQYMHVSVHATSE
ncbi:hypothetical protein [Stieleria varia]|uniref:DUF4350 domain-containing protein n=1 Tax=Stieleria varia TaxID=2528005 RepID=A0A5C5ZWM6_9BACT|nr:hypothetical protein [Stieleria varia]TWT92004.1 hypothetical protein Pla52n_64770 [Stieleria varia]